MELKFEKKITDKELDVIIDKIYKNYSKDPFDKYEFDLTNVEYISNQELLVLSGLLKHFYDTDVKFVVYLLRKNTPLNEINERIIKQIIQIWNVWQIWQIVPQTDYNKYFGIDGKSVQAMQKYIDYYPRLSEIYTRNGVTPFISLDYINNYTEKEAQRRIRPIYQLNSVVKKILEENNCYHPFTSNSLSSIITEELYLNFLDHAEKSSFVNFDIKCFMSISFQPKLKTNNYDKNTVQKLKAINFQTEMLEETRDFYYDKKTNLYKNDAYINFSFVDYGQGIVNTLRDEYKKRTALDDDKISEIEVLKFAFNYNTSRYPIFDERYDLERTIPRGLFDILVITKRYKGLIIIRSNYAKILYDFSEGKEIEESYKIFGDNKLYFPGTLISLYLPAIENFNNINISSIKPELIFSKNSPKISKYININNIVSKLSNDKKLIYSQLLQEMRNEIDDKKNRSLIFLSFKNSINIEKRILKKIFFFLISDYVINLHNNVVVINPPSNEIINEVEAELSSLDIAIKNYKVHPLPLLTYNEEINDISVHWLGIYDNNDISKLNDLLYEDYSLIASDFADPSNIVGHMNSFDEFGNLKSNLPSKRELLSIYKYSDITLQQIELEDLLTKYSCKKKDNGKDIFLLNGLYYQKEYIELNNLLNDIEDCNAVSFMLIQKIKSVISLHHKKNELFFIGISSTGHNIIKSLERQGFIGRDEYILIDNLSNVANELNEDALSFNKDYILICDVISTGLMVNKLNLELYKLGLRLEYVAVIVSIITQAYKYTQEYLKDLDGKIISLLDYPIRKYEAREILPDLKFKNIIRLNPYTQIPITLSIKDTNFNESVIFHTQISYSENNNTITINNQFLDFVDEDAIKIGYLKYNNVIHPYFFDTNVILRYIDNKALSYIFNKIDKNQLIEEKVNVFYPKKSGIEGFDFGKLKIVLNNDVLEEVEIERISTPEGWRFPHNINYLIPKIHNNTCLILDDGSCSGDSIIQMIDEISFYQAKEIILICFIGRVNDHKREFFSRVSHINVKNGAPIPLSIFFASHWHIPTYYMDDNPMLKETRWLQDVINLQNTPQSIKRIANNILSELKPRTLNDKFKDYPYLPYYKEKSVNKMPKKDLILIREEIGKIIGYRLYKENFIYFDAFMKKYDHQVQSKDRYKEIELLCAVFTYEPYLYDKVINVIPDVIEKIENFVRVLLYSYNRINKRLTYKWNKQDIIHLYFVVFKNEKLLGELTTQNIKILFEFTEGKSFLISYILYRVMRYFPLKEETLYEKTHQKQFMNLLYKIKADDTITNKEIKKFYNFITTLPTNEDIDSQLNKLRDSYERQNEPEFHDEKLSFNHNISQILNAIRQSVHQIEQAGSIGEKFEKILSVWFDIQGFLSQILSFAVSYKEYFLPYPYFRLINTIENGPESLRSIMGFNEELIFSMESNFANVEKLRILEKNIQILQKNFKVNSEIYEVVVSRQSNLASLISDIFSELLKLNFPFEVKGIPHNINYSLNIPRLYSDKLIKKELINNLRNYFKNEANSKVIFEFSDLVDNKIKLKIINPIYTNYIGNSGEGLKCLMLLSKFSYFGFYYNSRVQSSNFVQTLTFTINNGH